MKHILSSIVLAAFVAVCNIIGHVGIIHRSSYLDHDDDYDQPSIIATTTINNSVDGKRDRQYMTRNEEDSTTMTYDVPEYEFPTIDERFEYYMGDWYNKTDWKVTSCKEFVKLDNENNIIKGQIMHSTDMIFTLGTLKACQETTQYCKNAYNTLKLAETSTTNDRVSLWICAYENKSFPNLLIIYFSLQDLLAMFKFGDSRTRLTSQPVITKSRPALGSEIKEQSIIWPLNTNRHFIAPLEKLHEIKSNNQEVEWEDKIPKLFWRGTTTGQRVELLSQWIHYDTNVIDIAFDHIVGQRKSKSKSDKKFFDKYREKNNIITRQKVDIQEMLKYKYLLSIEGNDVATGLKWMLYSNSVVFMSPPTKATWAMEDLLLPFVHYIPVAPDYSNLLEMIRWAEGHQHACQVISKRATDFMDRLALSDQARIDTETLRKRLAIAYVSQFQKQLEACGETETAPNSSFAHGTDETKTEQSQGKVQTPHDQQKEVESLSCYEPNPRPIVGEYKNWRNNNMNAPKVLNMGFPKIGSTTLKGFLSQGVSRGKQLSTLGYNVSHWKLHDENSTEHIGSCMARAIKNNMPPLSTCGNYGAYTQMDESTASGCNFPQISYLDEIYYEEPSAIFILPFRNVSEWISSVSRYHDMRSRMTNVCEFPEYSFALGMGAKDGELEDLYCQHVKHIRKFVAERPSLTLVEYSIGAEGVGDYLAFLLPHMRLNGSHYGHMNINTK